MIIVYLIYFLIACFFLTGSGYLLVKSLIKVDKYYHIREFVIGFLLIGITTSMPELFIGIISALNDVSSLSFGNILGADIVDIAFVVAIVALLSKGIKFEAELEKRTIFIVASMVLLPLILFLDQEISRIDGIILIIAFFLYIIRLLIVRKKFKAPENGTVSKRELHKDIILFIISLTVLILSARLVVYAASQIAIWLSLPSFVIGLIVVSIGTSLPELLFEVNSVRKGHSSMALGDLFGSLAFNSTFILGIVSLISPIQVQFSSFIISSTFIIISLLTFLVFARTGKEITRKEGVMLLILYILFVIFNLLMK